MKTITLYIVTIDGTDEAVYLSQNEADSFVRATLEVSPSTSAAVEKRAARVEGGCQ